MLTGMRSVLVVDDSMLIRHTVCRWLEARGFTVTSATNGLEALHCLAECLPDLVITDLQMPKMSGGELIAALKAHPATSTIPIVVLASHQSATIEPPLARNQARIFKDIDIESQLEHALDKALARA